MKIYCICQASHFDMQVQSALFVNYFWQGIAIEPISLNYANYEVIYVHYKQITTTFCAGFLYEKQA